MANKRQRKKAAKKRGEWEGRQYQGGRVEGRKNLKHTDDGLIVNQYGVRFTEEDKRKLESRVNSANRKRRQMLKEAATLPRKVAGRDTGDTVASLQLMGKESDFIIQRKTKSLQRFTSREQFENYIDNLERVNKRDYLDERIRLYKLNHIKALENAYGDESKDIQMKIRMMKPADYMKHVMQDEDLEIGYVYDPTARQGKLNQMRASLGMRLKEDDYYDGDDYD